MPLNFETNTEVCSGKVGSMLWTVGRLIEATRGHLLRGNPKTPVKGISTDTRQIQAGDCFVALCGESHDGHEFLDSAVARGACAALVSRRGEDVHLSGSSELALIRVEDTQYGLGELARYTRQRHDIPVVGITGSNGKTSTKEMLASILGQSKVVLKNKGNFNNLIGVPLTLLSLQSEHQVAIVEMGINVPGEMERLVEISGPTAGLITNIHPAHLEGLVSMDVILAEKSKLWDGLGDEGLAAVNLDDALLASRAKSFRGRAITYSMTDGAAQVRCVGEVEFQDVASVFQMSLGGESVRVSLQVLGLHQVRNALAAAAMAWGMGEPVEAIAAGLTRHQPVKQRMQRHRLGNGCVVVDDSYNANPRSMLAAVETVCAASRGLPVVAVLGEMRELGPESAALHREVGRRIGALGVRQLIAMGEKGLEIVAGARESGMTPSTCRHFGKHDEIIEWFRANPLEKAWILVKGSRGMTMERVVEGILADDAERG